MLRSKTSSALCVYDEYAVSEGSITTFSKDKNVARSSATAELLVFLGRVERQNASLNSQGRRSASKLAMAQDQGF